VTSGNEAPEGEALKDVAKAEVAKEEVAKADRTASAGAALGSAEAPGGEPRAIVVGVFCIAGRELLPTPARPNQRFSSAGSIQERDDMIFHLHAQTGLQFGSELIKDRGHRRLPSTQ